MDSLVLVHIELKIVYFENFAHAHNSKWRIICSIKPNAYWLTTS